MEEELKKEIKRFENKHFILNKDGNAKYFSCKEKDREFILDKFFPIEMQKDLKTYTQNILKAQNKELEKRIREYAECFDARDDENKIEVKGATIELGVLIMKNKDIINNLSK